MSPCKLKNGSNGHCGRSEPEPSGVNLYVLSINISSNSSNSSSGSYNGGGRCDNALGQESPQSDFNGETVNKEESISALDSPPPVPVSITYRRRSRTTAIYIPPPPSPLWVPGHDCLAIYGAISGSTLIKFHTLATSQKSTHGMSIDDDLLSDLDFQVEIECWVIKALQVIEVWEQEVTGLEADAEQFVRVWRAFSNIDSCGNYSGAEAPPSINVNAVLAAPASSTAASSAAALAASPAAGASSLYSISTHGSPVDEGKESAPNDTTITKSLNSVKECISPSSFHSDQKFGGILASGKRDYESSSGSGSIVVGASKHSAVSFREAYGKKWQRGRQRKWRRV